MNQVELLDETNGYPHASALIRTLGALMSELGLSDREVTVVLMDDASIAVRNLHDRGEDEPTDVLSYPTFEPGGAEFPPVPHMGDVLISIETAQRQAQERGHPLEVEVLQLAAHGLTHLRGLDHRTEDEWRPFIAAQERAVQLLETGGE